MSILTQLRQLEKDRTRIKAFQSLAQSSYQELYPEYESAFSAAKNYQGTLTKDYQNYVDAQRTATQKYNKELGNRYNAYIAAQNPGSDAQLTKLKDAFETAKGEAEFLYQSYSDTYDTAFSSFTGESESLKKAMTTAESEVNRLYGVYETTYNQAVSAGRNQYTKAVKEAELPAQVGQAVLDQETQSNKLGQYQRGISDSLGSASYYLETDYFLNNILLPLGGSGSNQMLAGFKNYDSSAIDQSGNFTSVYQQAVTRDGRFVSARKLLTPESPGDFDKETIQQALDLLNQGKGFTAQQIAMDYYANAPKSDNLISQGVFEREVNASIRKSTSIIERLQSEAQSYRGKYDQLVEKLKKSQADVQAYQDLLSDTDYVFRYATEQSASSLESYQDYLDSTYTPAKTAYENYGTNAEGYATNIAKDALKSYQDYYSGTYTPAKTAYEEYQGTVSQQNQKTLADAKAAYQSYAQDTGFVDRAASNAKSVYDASLQKYQGLQSTYQELEEPLSTYLGQMQSASTLLTELNRQIPGLQRSLKVEQDPRKREVRIGYGRSLMTSGTKRRSSAR